MNDQEHHVEMLAFAWKLPILATTYFAGTMIGNVLVTSLGLTLPTFPGQTYDPIRAFIASAVLSAVVYLLARSIRGSAATRFLVLFAFTYVAYCVNNQIEGAIFTTADGFDTMLLFFLVPCSLVAGAAALLVQAPIATGGVTAVFSYRSVRSWWWRVILAWLAFPVIYYFFGAIAYPFVAEVYEGGELGVTVPSQSLIVCVVMVRSLFFLAVSIPVITRWGGSRRCLIYSLGAALTAMVGVAGLIEANWLPLQMRLVHMLEIAASSLVHAWVMVALLVPKAGRTEETLEPSSEPERSHQ
jgi:hypothetical protein